MPSEDGGPKKGKKPALSRKEKKRVIKYKTAIEGGYLLMKKHLVLALIMMLTLCLTSIAFAYTAGVGIKGSPHDLSKGSGSIGAPYGGATEQGGLNRICVYCHAPHHTIKPADAQTLGYAYVPLWNHDLTTQQFTMYANGSGIPGDPTRQAPNTSNTTGNVNTPTTSMGSPSMLCLSCHDGTVATDAYGNAGGPSSSGYGSYNFSASKSTGTQFIQGSAYQIGAGGDLTNHHPIGFNYFTAYTNSLSSTQGNYALAAPSTPMGTSGRTIAQLLWNATYTNKVQSGGTMECTTCHSVHNKDNQGQRLLWVEDTNSAFCMTCHLK